MRPFVLALICGVLAAQQTIRPPQPGFQRPPAQQPAAPAPTTPEPQTASPDIEDPGIRIPVSVDYVVTPVLAFDRNGGYVGNIRPEQFHLFDNDKEQNIQVDVSYTPISLVILIQANSNAQSLLPEVNKIGGLIGPQVIGDAGETAVIAYDARIRTMQEFTSDSDKIAKAIKGITPGSTSIRMVDAVVQGARLLRSRPRDRRRIMLLIGETRDLGSENRTREALIDLQMSNIAFYSVDMSRFMNVLTAPPKVGRPDAMPPAARPLPAGVPSTPTSVAQAYGTNATAQFLPLMVEIFRDAKAIFKANPVELFTKGTGGTEFGFHSQRTLETALGEIGEQLHSQYTLSYSPTNRQEGGFHIIQVSVAGHPEIDKIVTRPGYWVGPRE